MKIDGECDNSLKSEGPIYPTPQFSSGFALRRLRRRQQLLLVAQSAKLETHQADCFGEPPGFQRPPQQPQPPPPHPHPQPQPQPPPLHQPPAGVSFHPPPPNHHHPHPNHQHQHQQNHQNYPQNHHHHHHNSRQNGNYGGDGRPFGGHGADPYHHRDGGPHGGGFTGEFRQQHPVQNQHSQHHQPQNPNYPNHHNHHHHGQNQSYQSIPNHSEHNPSPGGRPHGNGGAQTPPPPPPPLRKRGFSHPSRGFSRDHIDGCSYAKLYVANISKTATEQEIRSLFEEFGHIVEVVQLKDKSCGQPKGACFVKYATIEEADRAIQALSNQHIFPGESVPLKLKYADGELERLDRVDGLSVAKLYVQPVSRTASEQEIRSVFEEFGRIVEVVQLKDKISGQPKGACFIKYATIEEADKAMQALNNQHIFPGEAYPIKMKYADGELERLGLADFKLYVGCLNRQASKKDVEEIFIRYGHVEDVYILRDDWKHNRGFGFIRYARREMALAAISALNGTFVMKGCEQPLIVRFAEPKKPKTAESRLTQNFGGPLDQRIDPDSSYPLNLSALVQQNSTGSQPKAVSQMKSQLSAPPCFMQPPLQPQQLELSSQQSQTLQEAFQSKQVTVPDNQITQSQPSIGSSEPHQDSDSNMQQPLLNGSNSLSGSSTPLGTIASSTISVAPAVLLDLPDCDWSEHICPDGDKYYYNCVTFESRWEKPKEFILFEQKLREMQQVQKLSTKGPPSLSQPCSHFGLQHAQTSEVQLPFSTSKLKQHSVSA